MTQWMIIIIIWRKFVIVSYLSFKQRFWVARVSGSNDTCLGCIHLSTSERRERVFKWVYPRRNYDLSLGYVHGLEFRPISILTLHVTSKLSFKRKIILLIVLVLSNPFQKLSQSIFSRQYCVIHYTDVIFGIQSDVRM